MHNFFLFLPVFATLFCSVASLADCLERAEKHAGAICGEVSSTGGSTRYIIDGELSAEAKGLISRFLGQAAGSVQSGIDKEKYEGVLKEHLVQDRFNVLSCRQSMSIAATAVFCKSQPNRSTIILSDACDKLEVFNVRNQLGCNRPYWQKSIKIDGLAYEKGLIVHPESGLVSRIKYVVPDGYKVFTTIAGIADDDKNPDCKGVARATLKVNGNVVRSYVLKESNTYDMYALVRGGDTLWLEVDEHDKTIRCDHVVFANPYLN